MKNKLIYLLVILFTVSCSSQLRVEKRRYTKGYYVEVNEKDKSLTDKTNQSEKNNFIDRTITELAYYSGFEKDTLTIALLDSKNEVITENLTASTSKGSCSLTYKTNPISSIDVKTIITKRKKSLPFRNSFIKKNIETEKVKLFSRLLSSSGSFGFILGGLFLALGIIVLLFLSILIGIILLVLGLILIIVGAVISSRNRLESTDDKDANEVVYENLDVVYLKNGSIIKGKIIEEEIDKFVKIQTRDGSIFVYNMDEVEKILMEKQKVK